MTCYQNCHRHLGLLTRETDIARKLLEKHGRVSVQAVKELRDETDMPMGECADMLQCLRRDMELERLHAENAKLWELCKAWSKLAYELFDEFIGEPEMSDDFMELDDRMRDLGVEVE